MRKIVVCISGFAGSGKSTLGRKLAGALGLSYISGGDGLKLLAIKRGYRPGGVEWWETGDGLRFLEERMRNPDFDREVDQQLVELAEKGNVVIDSWVLPWLYKGGFNIWLKASLEVRARRVSRRSGVSFEEALRILEKRDRESSELYQRIYGIALGRDFEPFHLILDTSDLDEESVFRIALTAVKEFFRLG
ncbi:MAG: cytidylate kinase family protein [Nitrososphaerota archaeon]